MSSTTNNDRAAVAAALLGDAWHGLPDVVRGACADFVDVMLDTAAVTYWDDACAEAADSACPIYDAELLSLLSDPAACAWLDSFDVGDMMTGGGTLSYRVVNMVGLAFTLGLRELFEDMVHALLSVEGWAAFGLSEGADEIACGLFDEWSGTVGDLVAAAAALGAVAA
jgi:hypothetical protein